MVEKFKIRLANVNDMENVFNLSNDEIVRQNSINPEKIEWENHIKWFNNKIKDENCLFYIAEDENKKFIGQIRIDKINNENVVSISISKDFRGKGLASEILKKTIKKSNLNNVVAYIFEENISSIKSFEKSGFKKSNLLKYEYKKRGQ